MFVDEIEITIKAGDGGRGKVSFAKSELGPDGGNGGDGGDVYIVGSSRLDLLAKYSMEKEIAADNGVPGSSKKMFGKFADDLYLEFPVGSHFLDLDRGHEFELREVGEKILLCKGGRGGVGNFELRSSINTTPEEAIPPEMGMSRRLKIELKFIADFGLIGLPSSGKSSLLNELTNANVKVGAYHFTTVSPNLGVLPSKKILADIPGLIEGASAGRGLGIKFLKHIQKVSLLLHCISVNFPDPLKDYKIIRKELGEFDKDLLKKKEILLLTKSDLVTSEELKTAKDKLKSTKKKIISVSIYNLEELTKLTKLLV